MFLIGYTAFSQDQSPSPKKKKHLDLEFSKEGGFYEEGFELTLRSPGATIYYTLDGSTPNKNGIKYLGSIPIKKTTVIRAKAYNGKEKSKSITHSYFIDEPYTTFPTVSIAITPSVLFDAETGLYVKGPNAIDSLWKKDGANFWSRKEVLINTEFFEKNGKREFNSVSGFRLFGGMSRLFPQKSMTIVTRDRYGKKTIKHKVFGKKGLKKFKFLVLRNSGSDWGKSHFRDAFMTDLVDGWNLDVQDSRPAHVYLNGEYWGIYNIREKVNRYFIEGHHELDKDSIDLIEHRGEVKRGSIKHYRRMLRYVKKNGLSDPSHFAYLKSQMDVDNFMDLQIAQIYFDNQDAGGNIKFWRAQRATGKWRWILYDTDWGFGLHSSKAFRNNSLAFHTKPDGPDWPNPPWSTFLLRNLLDNEEFKIEFINRFADRINTTFEPEKVVSKIDKYYNKYNREIDRHHDRWNLSRDKWILHVNRMRRFARKRPEYMLQHLQDYFQAGELIDISVSSTHGGTTILNNNIKLKNESFEGKYFDHIPIHLQAIPNFGYRFSHWEGVEMDEEAFEMTLDLDKNNSYTIRAVFEKYEHPLEGQIMINEVSANNRASGDWVELYNRSEESVYLKDWIFTDKKHSFRIPPVVLHPDAYVVLCEDTSAFRKVYPKGGKLVGNFLFGLSKKKEVLCLYTNDGASVDSVSYKIKPRDSLFTMNLLLPHLDNGDFENWEILDGSGTPNDTNPYYLQSIIEAEQALWMRIGITVGIFLCGALLLFMRFQQRRKLKLKNVKSEVNPLKKPL